MTEKTRLKTLKADDLSCLIENNIRTRSAADQLIADAKARAAQIIEEARQEADHQHKRLEDLSHDTLKTFIDDDTIKRHAAVFVEMLQTLQDIRETHNDVAPWLEAIVKASVEKLIGLFDDSEAIARIVAEGLTDLNQNYSATLRCSVKSQPLVKQAMAGWPELFLGVERCLPDPSLAEGELFLDCHAGSIEITLTSQFDALLDAIGDAVRSAETPGSGL